MPSRTVWLAVVLFMLGSVIWAVVIPLFHAPDEAEHYDLISSLASDTHYPQYDERAVNGTVDQLARDYLLAGGGYRQPHFGGMQPPRAGATANLSDPVVYPERVASNQMPQHPPLYYQGSALVLRAVRWVHPGARSPSIATEVFILRLLNIVLVSSLPLAFWAVARQLTPSVRAAEVAAFSGLLIPELLSVNGAINNDNLLTVLGAWLTVVVVAVARGRTTWRLAVAGGLLLGAALLTKGFAIVFVPALALAYLFAALRTKHWAQSILQGAAAAGIAVVLSGWFWIGNIVRQGSASPTTFFERAPHRPAGSVVDHGAWIRQAAYAIPQRFWGSAGRYAATMAWPGWTLLSALVLAGVIALLARRGEGLQRRAAVAGLVPILLLTAYVLQHAHHIYVVTGWTAFLQGRYLYSGLAGLLAAAACGWARITGDRVNHRHVLAVAAVAQLLMVGPVLENIWGGPGVSTDLALHTVLAWTPMPSGAVAGVVVAFAIVAVFAVWSAPAARVGVALDGVDGAPVDEVSVGEVS
jgi:small subunit ribosomal protein S36